MHENIVRLSALACDEILAARHATAPREACGLLLGRRSAQLVRVELATRAANLARRERAFEVDPGAIVAAEDTARALGLELVGAWHSHPHGDHRPSRADFEGAWGGYVTLIAGTRLSAWIARETQWSALALIQEAHESARKERPHSLSQRRGVARSAGLCDPWARMRRGEDREPERSRGTAESIAVAPSAQAL